MSKKADHLLLDFPDVSVCPMDIFEHSPGYIYWKDKESKYLGCNLNWAKLVGLKLPVEIVGKTDEDLPKGNWQSTDYMKAEREVINTGVKNACIGKLPATRNDGKPIHVKIERAPLKGKNNEIQGIFVVALDITEEKLAEHTTHSSIEDIFYNLPGLIYWKNKNSQYMGFNKNVVALSGLSREELLGKTDKELNWGEGTAESFEKDDQEVMKTGRIKITEYQIPIKRSDGNYYYVRTEKIPLYGKNGEVIGVLAVSIDMTEQKKVEEKLTKEKEDAFHNLGYIISHMPGFIYWKNKHSQYMGCNNNLAKFSHLNQPEDIIGKTDHDFDWGKKQADQFIEDDKKIMATGETLTTEYELPTKRSDGHYLYVRTDKMPFYDKKGNTIGILAVAMDVTEQKLLERNILEEKSRVDAANKIKTEFINNMEHDIRTPFCGIWGMANLLWEKETDDTKKEWLGDISQCAKQLLDYCNDILDFSKIESNERLLIDKKFNLHDVLSDVVKIETPPAKIKKLILKSHYDESLPKIILGDNYRLYRILINLVGNAIKFTHEGEISIKFKLAKKEAKQIVVQFIVIDTGIGIPEEKQLQIYEKFSKLSPSNKGLYKGVGIGLTIVKQFISEMDGEIEVLSEVGSGSTFICTIPFKLPLLEEF